MAEVTFYHQERVDGGRRSGVFVEGTAVLQGFIPGDVDQEDSALAWYVDVTLDTPTPPTRTNALPWLERRWARLRAALREAGQLLSCGLDVDTIPWAFQHTGPDGPLRVSVSAMQRLTARRVGEKLTHLAETECSDLFPALLPQG